MHMSAEKIRGKVIYVFMAAGRFGLNVIYLFHKLCPVKNRIAIVSRQSDVPYADLGMLKDEISRLSPDTEVIISCRMIGEGISGKISYLMHLVTTQMHLFATSKAVILDTYCISASMLRHKKKLKIIQMWHAMGAFKRFGYSALDDAEGRSSVIAKGMCMHRNYDVVFISSEACRKPMAQSFGCREEMLEVMPLPRVDLLKDKALQQQTAEKIRSAYPQIIGKRVILYAPTFRKSGKVPDYAKQLIDAADDKNICLVVKLHPIDREKITAENAIIDDRFSSLEWLSTADDVITDYSAFIYEAAAAGKCIYRYVPDDADYDQQRGFLVDIRKEFPFFYSGDPEQVLQAAASGRCDPEALQRFTDKYICPGENYTGAMASYILALTDTDQ